MISLKKEELAFDFDEVNVIKTTIYLYLLTLIGMIYLL